MPQEAKKSILLVEDEAILAMAEKMALEKYGYAVQTVNTGEKAIAFMNSKHETDLILMDINLGNGIDGTEAAKQILKDYDIPIVFLSSHMEPEIVGKTEEITSFGYVVKNSSITVLDASIKMAFKLFDAHKKIEAKAKSEYEHSQFLENIMDSFPGLIFWKDQKSIYQGCSKAFAKSAGLESQQDIIGRSDYELPWKEHEAESYIQTDRRVLDKGISQMHINETQFTASGSEIVLDTSKIPLLDLAGNVYGILGVSLDITERTKSEKRMNTLTKAIEASPVCVVITDKSGSIEYVNPKFVSLTGYSYEDAIGQNPRFLKSGLTEPRTYDELWNALSQGNVWRGTFTNRKKNGEIYFESATISPVKSVDGEIVNYIALKEDVTALLSLTKKAAENENTYYSLFNTVKHAIYIQNPDLTFANVNDGAASMYGYEKEYFIGKTAEFLSAPNKNDLEKIGEYVRLAFEGHPQKYEFWGRRKDGTIFPKDVWTIKGKYFGRDVAITLANDITERKKAEEDLRTSKETNEMLLNVAAEIIISQNFDGTINLLNESGHRILGYESPELIGKNFFDLCLPEDEREQVREYIQRLQTGETKIIVTYENSVVTKSGDRRNILWHNTIIKDADGTAIALLSSGQDITERNKVSMALKERNERYELLNQELKSHAEKLKSQNIELQKAQHLLQKSEAQLVEAERIAKIGNWTMNLKTKEISASKGALEIFGINKTKITIADLQQIPLPEYRAMRDKAHRDLIEQFIPYDIEFKICKPNNGAILDVHAIARYDKKTNMVFGVMQDITEKNRANLALRASEGRYGLTLQAAMDGFLLTDRGGNILDVNESYCKMSGYDKEELICMKIADISAELSAKDIGDTIQKIYSAGPSRILDRHRRKDHSLFSVEASVFFYDHDGGRIACFIRDIAR